MVPSGTKCIAGALDIINVHVLLVIKENDIYIAQGYALLPNKETRVQTRLAEIMVLHVVLEMLEEIARSLTKTIH